VLTNIDDKLMQKSTQNHSNSGELQQTVTVQTPFDRGFCFSNFLDDPDTTPNEMTLQGSIGTISGKSAFQKCHEVSGERIPNSSTTEVFEIPGFLHAGNHCHAHDALTQRRRHRKWEKGQNVGYSPRIRGGARSI
jgi:hypothetical protein